MLLPARRSRRGINNSGFIGLGCQRNICIYRPFCSFGFYNTGVDKVNIKKRWSRSTNKIEKREKRGENLIIKKKEKNGLMFSCSIWECRGTTRCRRAGSRCSWLGSSLIARHTYTQNISKMQLNVELTDSSPHLHKIYQTTQLIGELTDSSPHLHTKYIKRCS